MELDFTEKETKHFVQNRWIDLREVWYTMPDGELGGPYYTYSRKNYAVIVATDTEGRFICVQQFRSGLGRVTTEFPAGGLEREGEKQYGPDEEGQEPALEAAQRELLEETGYVSAEWESVITVPSQATMADNLAYIFRAKNCRLAAGQHLDETEFLNVLLLAPGELEARIHTGGFEQAVHIMAWALCRLQESAGD